MTMTADQSPLWHRPLGSGHPYRVDPDQRHPVVPVVGEPVELRVLVTAGVDAAWVDLEPGDASVALTRVAAGDLYPTGETAANDDHGHLAAASGACPDLHDRTIWRAVIGTPDVTDGPLRYRFRWRSHWTGGETEWFEAWPARWQPTGGELALTDPARLVPDSTEWLVTQRGPVRVRFAMPLAPGEHVCGFGERFDHVDQRGRLLDTVVFEQYKQQGARTYMPSPFAIVAAPNRPAQDGWGFHVQTSRRCWFDVGADEPDRLQVEVALSHVEPEPNPRVDAAIYSGTPRDVLDAHLDSIGRPVLPPAWVFRPWMSGNEWNSQARVLAEVERSIELDIPVGVVVIEAWSDESTFTVFNDATYEPRPDGSPCSLDDFTFPANGRWPDPRGMVDRLHELGVKALLWQIPLVPTATSESDCDLNSQAALDAEVMVERGYCVGEDDGSPYRNRGWWFPGALMPDWTNPDALHWWLAKRRYLLDEVGIDGFKTDGGEHAWGDELRYHDASRGDASNNLYPLRYAQAYHRLIRDSGADGVTFSRAGFSGAGSAPCHWAGDEDSTWEAFRASVIAGQTAGISGIPFWGWDLAGFSGEIPSVELFLRAAAMAVFTPIMQYHSEFNHHRQPSNDRTPWNLAECHGDDRAITIYRQFAQLREQLVPHLVRWAEWSVETGTPMMRPLWFDDPTDAESWNHPYQYRFGPDLVIAPICWPGTDPVDVYLPRSEWVDAWTGEPVAGGAVASRAAAWDRIPVYTRTTGDADLGPMIRGHGAD